MVAMRLLVPVCLALICHGCGTLPAAERPAAPAPAESDRAAPPPVPIVPGRAEPAAESPALRGVIEECWAHIDAARWGEAIVSAERGLRIERRSAELYLVLARAYSAVENFDQARAFARQGLRYGDRAPAAVTRQLHSLLEAVGEP